jgi:hypothetical protein
LSDSDIDAESIIEKGFRITRIHKKSQAPIILGDSANPVSAGDAKDVLEISKVALLGLKQYLVDVNTGLIEQHGALLEYSNMPDLMNWLKETVDANTAALLHTQAIALTAAQACNANEVIVGEIDKLVEYYDSVLGGELTGGSGGDL